MHIPSLFKSDELLDRYKQLRQIGIQLNNELVKLVPKAAIQECGKKLGLIQGKILVLDNEDELTVLFDYCLHNYRRADKNIIERYLETSPPPASSDEMLILQGKLKSYYSVFSVKEVRKGKGAILLDIIKNKEILLMDIGVGQSAVPGLVFAGRIVPVEDFYMTTGTFLPVSNRQLLEKGIIPVFNKFLRHKQAGEVSFSPAQEAALSAQIIRLLLRAGALDKMMYRDI